MTNAERIRGLSDADLAVLMMAANDCEVHIPFCQNKYECMDKLDRGEEIADEKCLACMVQWLHKEVDDGEE